ncbi:MAG TPA: hypothetical protein PLX95_03340 [bacterium]|nr:hypothetical protein [bacterium]
MQGGFNILEVTGDYTQVGSAIGKKFKDTVQKRIQLRREKIPNYSSYLDRCQEYF